MDLNDLLKDVKHLNEYIAATHDVSSKFKNSKAYINLATVETLKRIRSLEIEYLNKCGESGAACLLFDRLLCLPPSKAWGALAKDLINTLKYWLDAIRKHLINHSIHWWMFLKIVLKFFREVHLKDRSTIPNVVVEIACEGLLDLATALKPDMSQRHEILCCINMVCQESSREIRFAMRNKCAEYLKKLAEIMATSGYVPCQYSALECLLRWVVPRGQDTLRAAADRWLPVTLCPLRAKDFFQTLTWKNFLQDARIFLNALNKGNGLVTSVICRQLSVGHIVLIDGTDRQESWLDINTTGSLSVFLRPCAMQKLGVPDHRSCEALIIDCDNAETALLKRGPLGLTILISMLRAPCVRPIDLNIPGGGDVTIVVSSRANLQNLDSTLRAIFRGKYLLRLDLDSDVSQSPQISVNDINDSEDYTRFSHPVGVKRRNQTGELRSRNAVGTPSSVSSSSLANLRNKLSALPRFMPDKEPLSVCIQPALSSVTERTEDERSVATLKFQDYGVRRSKIDQSKTDCESTPKPKKTVSQSRSDGEAGRPRNTKQNNPGVGEGNAISILLLSTVGSDESVINETIEKLSKHKDYQNDNRLCDLLLQEALGKLSPEITVSAINKSQGEISDSGDLILQEALRKKSPEITASAINKSQGGISDSGINTDEKKSQEVQSEAIDNTPNEPERERITKKKITIVNKSTTSDESNTEVVNATPVFVTTRKPNRTKPIENKAYPIAIDAFFSQHAAKYTEQVINPAIARENNETSSETSFYLEDDFLMENGVNTDVEFGANIFNSVEECVNYMLDKVASDFYKPNARSTNPLEDEMENFQDKPSTKPAAGKPKRNYKLRAKPQKKKATKSISKKAKQQNIRNMSTIIEKEEEIESYPETNEKVAAVVQTPQKTKSPAKDITTLERRKRKLYSPKDDTIVVEINDVIIQENIKDKESDEIALSEIKSRINTKTSKIIASSYKQIEKDKYFRSKGRGKGKVAQMPSPRTMKMNNMFDNLKQTVESNDIILVEKKNAAVYNFTSDSEDEDFKKKKDNKNKSSTVKEPKKRACRAKQTTCVYSSTEDIQSKPAKRKKPTKRANKRKSDAEIEPAIGLIDEKMREADIEKLNTSILLENNVNIEETEIMPIHEPPQMEPIRDESNNTKKRVTDARTIEILTVKKEKGLSNKCNQRVVKDKLVVISDKDDDITTSPLPGLVVESMPKANADVNETFTTNALQKFKNIYRNGPDVNDSVNTQNMISDNSHINFYDDVDVESEKKVKTNKKFVKEPTTRNVRNNENKSEQNIKSKNINKKFTTKNSRNMKIKSAQDTEIMVIPETVDECDKSVSSDGIRAHIDSDEEPPGIATITEKIQPRELYDMDESTRENFVKLMQALCDSDSNNRDTSVEEKKAKTLVKPIVVLKRLTDNINKWVPSRHTSHINSHPSDPNCEQNETQTQETPTTSPAVVLERLSLEEFNKWLPMPSTNDSLTLPKKSSGTDAYCARYKAKSSVVDVRKGSDEVKSIVPTRRLRSHKDVTLKSYLEDPVSRDTDSDDPDYIYKPRKKLNTKLKSTESDKNYKETWSKTIISPVRCDVTIEKTESKDSKSNNIRSLSSSKNSAGNWSSTERSEGRLENRRRPLECYTYSPDSPKRVMERPIRPPIRYSPECPELPIKERPNESLERPIRSLERPIRSIERPIRYIDFPIRSPERPIRSIEHSIRAPECPIRSTGRPTRSPERSIRAQERPIRAQERPIRSPERPIRSTERGIRSTKRLIRSPERPIILPLSPILKIPTKRKSDSPNEATLPKKRKHINILEDMTVESGRNNIASIIDRFIRAHKSDRDDSFTQIEEFMRNLLEKLDTTLVASNQKTSKLFVDFLAAANTELKKEMSGWMMAIQKKLQEEVTKFMGQMMSQAADIVGKDSRQKEAFVMLLKEDVEACLAHIARVNKNNNP